MIPHRYKKFGWPIFIIGIILSIDEFREGWYRGGQGTMEEFESLWPWSILPILGNIGGLLVLLSLVLFAFCKSKVDDEYLDSLRYRALIVVFLITALIGILVGEGFDIEMNVDLTVLVFFSIARIYDHFSIYEKFYL